MEIINLHIEEIGSPEGLRKHGIVFRDVAFVRLLIDGEDLEEDPAFEDALVYLDELLASASGSGRYLIFTCACGIAEDGGWEGVIVRHGEETVEWTFDVDMRTLHYTFDRRQYLDELAALQRAATAVTLPFEPAAVIFPPNFQRLPV